VIHATHLLLCLLLTDCDCSKCSYHDVICEQVPHDDHFTTDVSLPDYDYDNWSNCSRQCQDKWLEECSCSCYCCYDSIYYYDYYYYYRQAFKEHWSGPPSSMYRADPSALFLLHHLQFSYIITGPPNGPPLFCSLASVGIVCRRLSGSVTLYVMTSCRLQSN